MLGELIGSINKERALIYFAEMPAEELAGLVCEALLTAGITTTLSGGGCAAIWSEGKYVSRDLDCIEEGPVPRRKVKALMAELD